MTGHDIVGSPAAATPGDLVRTPCGSELLVHQVYGVDPAAPVVLEQMSGGAAPAGQFVLVSRAMLRQLCDGEERS